MDDLFGIQFISRNDITAQFTVPNTDDAKKNWKLILAALTFYSVALMETASDKEGFFTYIKDGQECRKDIPAACRDFLDSARVQLTKLNTGYDFEFYDYVQAHPDQDMQTMYQDYMASKGLEIESEDSSTDDSDNESDDAATDAEACNLLAPILTGNGVVESQIKPTHIPPRSWPVGHYFTETNNWTANAYSCHGEVGDKGSFVADFSTCTHVVAEITKIKGDFKDTAGNYGDCLSPKSIEQIGIGGSVNGHVTLNLDKFRVKIETTEADVYEARFTPITGVHHAASMCARKCAVKWRATRLQPLLVLNAIILRVVSRTPEVITIETEYLALDCL